MKTRFNTIDAAAELNLEINSLRVYTSLGKISRSDGLYYTIRDIEAFRAKRKPRGRPKKKTGISLEKK